jgi:hypothetical protein
LHLRFDENGTSATSSELSADRLVCVLSILPSRGDAMMLVGAFAFSPAPVARYARPHNALSAATMSVAESEDTIQAADDVLEMLLEVGAPTGMRRQMAEGLRKRQLAITDLVSSADGVTFQGGPL